MELHNTMTTKEENNSDRICSEKFIGVVMLLYKKIAKSQRERVRWIIQTYNKHNRS